MNKLLTLAFVSLASVVSLSTVALADAIGPGPPDCPAGSTSESSHDGMWCAPSTCAAASPCGEGLKCAQAGLCVTTEQRTRSGRRPSNTPPSKYEVQIALGPCTTQADCALGGQCVTADRCVPQTSPQVPVVKPIDPPPTPTPTPTPTTEAKADGASCAAAPVAPATVLAVFLAARRRRWSPTLSASR